MHLKDQPGLPPRAEVRGARKLDPLSRAGLYLVRERHQCELLECPLAVGAEEGKIHIRGPTRLQKLGNRRELILRRLYVLVGVIPTGTPVV